METTMISRMIVNYAFADRTEYSVRTARHGHLRSPVCAALALALLPTGHRRADLPAIELLRGIPAKQDETLCRKEAYRIDGKGLRLSSSNNDGDR
jgi:hypothetical protein